MHLPENIVALIEKYQLGTITADERALLDEWYKSFNHSAETGYTGIEFEVEQQIGERIKDRLLQNIRYENEIKKFSLNRNWRLPVAASLLLVLSLGGYFMFTSRNSTREIATKTPTQIKRKNEIVPGGNKAILTLANGTVVVLDSTADGLIGQQGNTKIQKSGNGLLDYDANGSMVTENDALFFNTISTPRGGQYQVALADGSKVWLNAASSIRFPAAFTGKERKVEITGEAYFEVAKNKLMPFKVKAGSQEIQVLGTHFNVSTYDDEALSKTTLLEGRVRITKNNSSTVLIPGQQAQMDANGALKVIKHADLEGAVAWKDGLFMMKNEDIGSIMRQIARWYDVDIFYPHGHPTGRITGDIPRNMDLAKVLKVMELNGVHFTIESRMIIVQP